MPSPDLPFNDHYKEALLKYDFAFFNKINIDENNYSEADLELMNCSYRDKLDYHRQQRKRNPRQYDYWLEGIVRKYFMGKGFLPGFFRLDGWTVSQKIFDFEAHGESWAVFEQWQKYERRRHRWKKSWEVVTKVGAVLAIILTILKLMELFGLT